MIPINDEAQAGRLQLVLFVAGLLISLGTAAVSLNVKAEIMETRVLLLEKLSEASRQYPRQSEFNRLEDRVSDLEREHRHK
jgi:hypothetical protein